MRSVIISNQQFQITDYKLSVITDFKAGLVSVVIISKQGFQIIDFKLLISKQGFVRQMEASESAQKQLETAGIQWKNLGLGSWGPGIMYK
jgi:hypothetical protein